MTAERRGYWLRLTLSLVAGAVYFAGRQPSLGRSSPVPCQHPSPANPPGQLPRASAHAYRTLEPEDSRLKQQLRAVMAPYVERGLFQGAVLLRRELGLAEFYAGDADRERPRRNGPDTLFRLASVSKHFVAAAVLALQEQGLLHVDDPLRRHFPEWPGHASMHAGAPLRVKHLLRHTSGLARDDPFRHGLVGLLLPGRLGPPCRAATAGLRFTPGREYEYNNLNYDLLATLIERVTRTDFDAFVRARLLQGSAARNIAVTPTGREAERLAKGYQAFALGWIEASAAYGAGSASFPSWAGSGNMFASVRDLDLWLQDLFAGKILSPQSLSELTTPGLRGYAYGLIADHVDGRPRLSHGGALAGFATQVELFPQHGAALLILSNGDASGTPMRRISADLRALLHEDRRAPTTPSAAYERSAATLRAATLMFLGDTAVARALQAIGVLLLLFNMTAKRSDRVAAWSAACGGLGCVMLLQMLSGTPLAVQAAVVGCAAFGGGAGVLTSTGNAALTRAKLLSLLAALAPLAMALTWSAERAAVLVAASLLGGFASAISVFITHRAGLARSRS